MWHKSGEFRAAGWYGPRTGPHDTLRAACEASGVEYPGETTLRTAAYTMRGDLEAVVRA